MFALISGFIVRWEGEIIGKSRAAFFGRRALRSLLKRKVGGETALRITRVPAIVHRLWFSSGQGSLHGDFPVLIAQSPHLRMQP
jgi:hypothetical protein